MKIKIIKLILKFAYKIKYYKRWSKLYNWLYNRDFVKYFDAKIALTNNSDLINQCFYQTKDLQEIEKRILMVPYKKDGFKELWDVSCSPGYSLYRYKAQLFLAPEIYGAFDCDEYARLAAYMVDTKEWSPTLLSVIYQKSDKSVSGHMVCIMNALNDLNNPKYYHLSNWGLYGPYNTTQEILDNILGEDKTIISWCLYKHETLDIIDYYIY